MEQDYEIGLVFILQDNNCNVIKFCVWTLVRLNVQLCLHGLISVIMHVLLFCPLFSELNLLVLMQLYYSGQNYSTCCVLVYWGGSSRG